MKPSKISWTDYSAGDLNFVTGCTPISEGCKNCYARVIYKRWGRDFDTVTTHEKKLRRVVNMRRPDYSDKRGHGYPPMYFVCDTGDLFHPDVPDGFITRVFDMMAYSQWALHPPIWQVLTKRPERMRDLVRGYIDDRQRGRAVSVINAVLPNVWLGVTAENQQRSDERIPILLDTPAAVRFVSVEPMLEPMTLARYMPLIGNVCWDGGKCHHECKVECWRKSNVGQLSSPDPFVDWVICGAESGHNRRPFDVEWAMNLYRECKAAGVPFFFKQGSALGPGQGDSLQGIGTVKEWPSG